MSMEPTKPVTTDEAEPTAGHGPAPLFLIAIFGLLIYGAMVYLEAHGGGFESQVYRPYTSLEELKNLQGKTGDGGPDGQKIFNTYCAVCHQPTGMGLPGQFPPLAGSEWVNTTSPNRIIRIVLYGFKGPVQVEGHEFNNNMLAWKPTLKPEEIAAVLTFVRGNKAWGNNAPKVKTEQVTEIIKALASRDDSEQFTSDEVSKVPLD